jgi:hypothetical protein
MVLPTELVYIPQTIGFAVESHPQPRKASPYKRPDILILM